MTGLFLIGMSVLAMAWIPGGVSTPWPAIALWLVAFAGYAMAARGHGAVSGTAVWGGAIAVRLGLLGAAPTLSEDVYRYVWDGWVLRNGINPFDHPPAAESLAFLRTEWWELINHPTVPTIYPPGAQFVFVALAWIAPAWLTFKVAWVAADLGVAWLISRLCRTGGRRGGDRRETPPLPVVLWLWNPLVLVEIAWSGHFDPVGVALMLGAVLVVGTRPLAAGALLGLGAAMKFAPLAAVPALFRRHGAVTAGIALGVPVALYLPFAGAGAGLFEGLRTYADLWEFNAGVYWMLESLPGPTDLGRWLGGAAVLVVAILAAARRATLEDTLFWTLGAGLLVSPTLHPWYVLWILPLACLRGNRAWILFSCTVFLAYAGRDAYLASGDWPEPIGLRLLIHGPFLALLLWDAKRGTGSAQGFQRSHEIAEREEAGERQ